MATVTQYYLEKCRTKLTVELGLKKPATDYQLTKLLDIASSSMTRYTKHDVECDEEIAYRIARFLDIPPMEIIGAVNAQKAKSDELKSFWEKAKRGSVAGLGAVALSGALMAQPEPAQAASIYHNAHTSALSGSHFMNLYTLCEVMLFQNKTADNKKAAYCRFLECHDKKSPGWVYSYYV